MNTCVVLAVLIAVATAEHCRMNTDCDAKNCVDGTVPMCMSNICTCDAMTMTTKAPMNTCTTKADCAHMHVGGHCNEMNTHCIDRHCRCMHH